MAPARRKGGGRNPPAAVTRREWKVGDLVLAKVKGFPAWPATVSEPQKWGYSTDWKKVLVYFFGTKQIAFCNPADVEAFTEEKKSTLLGKRYGKGSDFGRAVNEIVDTYEKLKKGDEGDQLSNEDATLNSENSENFPRETVSFSPKACASLDHSDSCSADGNPMATEPPELHDAEVASKGSVENAFGLDQLSQTHLSVKKISRVESGASQTLRKSRSSSRIDSDKHYQMFENDIGTIGFTYKNERIDNIVRESLHSSECPDLDLLAQSAIVSSNVCQVSEVLKVDAEAGVDNVHTYVKSSSSYEDHGPHGCGGCVENGTLSSSSDESEASAISVKRKRESLRSGEIDDVVETYFPDEERCPQNDLKKQNSYFSDVCENCDDKMFGVDDDEHLPLVKRARVRMGKIASNEICKEVDDSGNMPNFAEAKSLSSSCYSIDSKKSCLADYVRLNSSTCRSPGHLAENNTGLPSVTNFSDGNIVFDDESALPPSKRLHRALKAMNANVADDALQAEISENNEPPLRKCSMTSFSEKSSSFEAQDAVLSNGENSCIHAFSVLENESQTTPKKQKSINEVARDSRIDRDSMLVMKLASDSCQPRGELFDMEIDKNFSEANEKVLLSSSLPNHVVSTVGVVICREKGLIQRHLSEESIFRDLETVSSDNGDVNLCSGLEKPKVKGYFSSSCPAEGVKSLQSKFSAKLKLDMHELKKEAAAALTPTNNENLSKVSNNTVQFISPASASKTIDCTAVAEAMLSQHECSFTDQVSCHSNDGRRSCSVDGDNKKSLVIKDKRSSSELLLPSNQNSLEASKFQEANLIWRSFKAAVQSISRAKESISRATRFALDCAKHGLCHQVIEHILTHLESESNLHRRIDLFFLVDSITQCSCSQKGIKGVSYSSAVELVLPRLLSAAAALPGNGARENRKQCLKVLRLWLERRVLSESIVRQHLQELESYNETSFSYPVHPSRTERGLNDPLVEAEGMLVDEYGSNASIQLSGFTVPQMLEEEDSLYNGVQAFKIVTPEREQGIPEFVSGQAPAIAVERHPLILEEVDGELEMEDVAPTCDSDVNSRSSVRFVPPLPEELPPSPPPLPVSPPPTACSVHPSPLDQQPVIRMPSVFPRGVGDHWPRQSTSLAVNSVFSEPLPCRAPGLLDNSLRPSITPPFRSCGISRGPHPSIRPSNNDGKIFDAGMAPHKPPYHIRPPTVSSQFYYVHADSHKLNQPRNYSSNLVHQRSNFEPEIRGSNNVGCRNRMSPVEGAANERCRYASPANSGGQRHDKSEGFYPPIPHRPRPAEGPFSDHGWHISRRPLHLRHHTAVSPPFENLSRAPQFWRPR